MQGRLLDFHICSDISNIPYFVFDNQADSWAGSLLYFFLFLFFNFHISLLLIWFSGGETSSCPGRAEQARRARGHPRGGRHGSRREGEEGEAGGDHQRQTSSTLL